MYAEYNDDVAAVRAAGPVQQASQDIAGFLSDLDRQVRQLEDRLSSVLQPEVNAVSDGKLEAVARAMSPHSVELRKHADYIAAIGRRIGSILDRLEV